MASAPRSASAAPRLPWPGVRRAMHAWRRVRRSTSACGSRTSVPAARSPTCRRHCGGRGRDGVRAVSTQVSPSATDALVVRLRGVLERRYHHLHPFNQRMHRGELSRDELRLWVANRFYYQISIPIKDALILSSCPEREV